MPKTWTWWLRAQVPPAAAARLAPFIGLIGSKTKWATFCTGWPNVLARRAGACDLPWIGVPGIHGKQPEVIAVAVAAQLLQTLTL